MSFSAKGLTAPHSPEGAAMDRRRFIGTLGAAAMAGALGATNGCTAALQGGDQHQDKAGHRPAAQRPRALMKLILLFE